MSTSRHIYVLGIKPDMPEDTVTPWGTWADIHRIVESDLEHGSRNGFPYTLQVADGKNADASLEMFEKQLIEMRDQLAGLMFGTGIRLNKDVLPFERAIGIAVKVLGERVGLKGEEGVKIMLNDGPDRHCWAIERAFGVKMEVD